MKKELAFLMVTALLLGAAGCGSGGQSAETTAETAGRKAGADGRNACKSWLSINTYLKHRRKGI